MHPVAKQWCSQIQKHSPIRPPAGKMTLQREIRISRTWKRIFRELTDSPLRSVLEAGCGAGSQLIPLAWKGCTSVGIDCSYTTLDRCREKVRLIREMTGKQLPLFLICGDFFEISLKARYSLVFHRGVAEHFLDRTDRLLFIKKMFEHAEKNGYVISIVPSGIHHYRSRFKEERLGGYNIPEIDYSPVWLTEEAKNCGADRVIVLPHNIMGYLLYLPGNKMTRLIYKIVYLFLQVIPMWFLKESFKQRHAYSFICIAWKGA